MNSPRSDEHAKDPSGPRHSAEEPGAECPHDASLLIGRRLNQFDVLEWLAVEGSGTVYKARHSMLSQRFVALKIALVKGSEPHPLEREAQLIHRARHPRIVEVHDIVEVDGVKYMVMEYVAGRRLGDIVRDCTLDTKQILRYAHQMALALATLHTRGVGLCNLNERSVIVSDDQTLKIVDFSAATELESDAHTIDNASVYRSRREATTRLDVQTFGIMLQRLVERSSAHSAERLRTSLLDLACACSQQGSRGGISDGSQLVQVLDKLVHTYLEKARFRSTIRGRIAAAVALTSLIVTAIVWHFTRGSSDPYEIIRDRRSAGCTVDQNAPIKASAHMPIRSILRFWVLQADETPWAQPGKLRLFVGDGPSCGSKPHNVKKAENDVISGKSVQVIDLDVDHYDGKWSIGEEKVFWIGFSGHGFDIDRASGRIVIKRVAEH